MADFPFDIVGFDLDGTLLDTAADLAAAVNHALASVGRGPLAVRELRTMIGGGGGAMLRQALRATGGFEEADFPASWQAQLAYYEDHIAVHTQPYPGAVTALDALAARGVRVAVVTNKLEHLAVKLFTALGLADRFATILGGDSLGPGRAKPAPDLLQEMIARCGGGRAAFVGDTEFDVGAARAAGLPAILCSFGFLQRPAADYGADAVIDHFDELVPMLSKIAALSDSWSDCVTSENVP